MCDGGPGRETTNYSYRKDGQTIKAHRTPQRPATACTAAQQDTSCFAGYPVSDSHRSILTPGTKSRPCLRTTLNVCPDYPWRSNIPQAEWCLGLEIDGCLESRDAPGVACKHESVVGGGDTTQHNTTPTTQHTSYLLWVGC